MTRAGKALTWLTKPVSLLAMVAVLCLYHWMSSGLSYWGYIDTTGQFRIPPQFDGVRSFSDGLAAVHIGRRWGYIDKQGNVVIPLQFGGAGPFSEGLAVVAAGAPEDPQTRYGYIDKTGRYVIPPRFTWARPFSNGRAAACVQPCWKPESGNTIGYIDATGTFVISPQFNWANDFSEGAAAVRVGTKRSILDGQFGFIDPSGAYVIPPHFSYVMSPFASGLAATHTGYINHAGDVVIPATPAEGVSEFSDGLAGTKREDGVAFIDRFGKTVLTVPTHAVKSFAAGLAPLQQRGNRLFPAGRKWGYINKTGQFAIPPQFRGAQPFSEGLAAVSIRRRG